MIDKSKIKNQKSKLKRGFTLIEVIIALALILATLIIFGTALASLPLTKASRNQNLAYHVASKKMEEFRNTPYDSLPLSGIFSDPGLSLLLDGSGQFTIEDYEGSPDIKKVAVIVSWTDPKGGAKSVTLETLMGRNGLNKK